METSTVGPMPTFEGNLVREREVIEYSLGRREPFVKYGEAPNLSLFQM